MHCSHGRSPEERRLGQVWWLLVHQALRSLLSVRFTQQQDTVLEIYFLVEKGRWSSKQLRTKMPTFQLSVSFKNFSWFYQWVVTQPQISSSQLNTCLPTRVNVNLNKIFSNLPSLAQDAASHPFKPCFCLFYFSDHFSQQAVSTFLLH